MYTDILMPPGSDNINGLCFADNNARLYQMINCQISEILNSPFQSLAGLRYLLPFIDRTKLIPSANAERDYKGHSGIWELEKIINHLPMEVKNVIS